MYFQMVKGQLAPVIDSEGAMDISEASAKTNESVETLRQVWLAAFGAIFPEQEITGDPVAKAQPTAAGQAVAGHLGQAWKQLGTTQQRELIRQALYPQLNAEMFTAFEQICEARGLSIYCRHLYPELQHDQSARQPRLVVMTTIDALRMLAERSGKYRGQVGPQWCGDDEVWKDVWIDENPPKYARVGILREGFNEPIWGKARWDSYAPYTETIGGNVLDPFWYKWAPDQLAKCAEALGHRKAFPEQVGQLYAREEMQQAQPAKPVVPQDPYDQRRPVPSGAIAPGADLDFESALDEPLESKEEFVGLLEQAGYTTSRAQEVAIANYKGKYPLLKGNPVALYNRIAVDLRKQLQSKKLVGV